MAFKRGFVILFLCSVGSTFAWPRRSEPSEDLPRQKRTAVECKNTLDCFKCDKIKRTYQCGAYISVCAKTCNPACAKVDFADQPYKPCAAIKQQGNCMKPMPYSSSLWVSVCEKTCCVLDSPPKWGPWSEWGPCSKSCHYGRKTRTRECQGAGFGQTCEGAPFESTKCHVNVPCKGTVGWEKTAVTVNEDVGTVTIKIKRTVKTDCNASLTVNTNDGTAKQPADYTEIKKRVINFAKGETEKSVTFTIKKDNLIEPVETFTAVITADANQLNVDPATTTINIKDFSSKVGLRPGRIEVKENLKIVKVTVYREGCILGTNKVCISTVDGTAKTPGDYVAISKQKVVFAPKETTKEVSITIVDDGVDEQTEEFYVKLGCADPFVSIVQPGKTTVVILDDDVDGKWSEWSPYGKCSKSCGGGSQSRSRTCTNPKPQGGGKDCKGEAASSRECNTHHCPATVGLKPTKITVLENVGTVELTVFRIGNSIGTNKCKLSTNAGSALAVEDFVAVTNKDIIFKPGDDSKKVKITIVDNKALEQTESFQVKLSCPGNPGVTKVDPDTSIITILDDDVQIGLRPTKYSVRETDGSVTLKVFRKGYLKNPNTGLLSTCDQTAKASEDYTALKNFQVSFAPDETSKDVVVKITDDKVLEDIETFCATLTTKDPKVSNVDPPKAVISIVDNDVKVGFRPKAYEVIESKPSVVVKVYRVGNLKGVTKVILNTVKNPAKEGTDFTPLKDFPVTFKAGESLKSFKIPIIDDNIVEDLESFIVKMTTEDKDVTKIAPDVAAIKIIDDDAVIGLEPSEYCVPETAGALKVRVTRKGALGFEHTALLNSQDGTAIAPGDYKAISALVVKFAAKQAEQEVTVKIVDDNAEEGTEKFKLVLTTKDPRVTVKPNDVAVIKISDNDVDGRWSNWSDWSACGKTCGKSKQNRTRVCDPAPQGGGAPCAGSPKETRECFIVEHCPVDGGFSDWDAWGDCSKTCGGGFQLRSRTCSKPAPKYGGKPCIGSLVEAQGCNDKCCPVNGRWSYWDSWSKCKDGKQTRTRQCNNPAPSCGGSKCVGGAAAGSQSRDCPPLLCGAPVPAPTPAPYPQPAYDESVEEQSVEDQSVEDQSVEDQSVEDQSVEDQSVEDQSAFD